MNPYPHQHGVVYTETTIYSPPEQYAADAPYQIAIIDVGNGSNQKSSRVTVRILAASPTERARIGGPSHIRRTTQTEFPTSARPDCPHLSEWCSAPLLLPATRQ